MDKAILDLIRSKPENAKMDVIGIDENGTAFLKCEFNLDMGDVSIPLIFYVYSVPELKGVLDIHFSPFSITEYDNENKSGLLTKVRDMLDKYIKDYRYKDSFYYNNVPVDVFREMLEI